MSTINAINYNGTVHDIEDSNFTEYKDFVGVNTLWTSNVGFSGVSYGYAYLPQEYQAAGYKLSSDCGVVATINTAHGLASIASVSVIDYGTLQVNLSDNYNGNLVISFMTELSK